MTPAVRSAWRDTLEQIERAELHGPGWPELRLCATCWYVCGIAYEAHQRPLLSDAAYDKLSAQLLAQLGLAHAVGADLLEAGELAAGTAMNWKRYPAVFHEIARDLCAR